jgi:hypothetical protein
VDENTIGYAYYYVVASDYTDFTVFAKLTSGGTINFSVKQYKETDGNHQWAYDVGGREIKNESSDLPIYNWLNTTIGSNSSIPPQNVNF